MLCRRTLLDASSTVRPLPCLVPGSCLSRGLRSTRTGIMAARWGVRRFSTELSMMQCAARRTARGNRIRENRTFEIEVRSPGRQEQAGRQEQRHSAPADFSDPSRRVVCARISSQTVKKQKLMTAIKTPFLEDGRIDIDMYDRLVEIQVSASHHTRVPPITTWICCPS